MSEQLLSELNQFIGKASKATYASGGGKVDQPQRAGFKELEHREGDWYYRDSYTGFLRSWGQEVVWHSDQPFWTCLYGGGMTDENMNEKFALETFSFLKKALSEGDKETMFQPRGPKYFEDDNWQYHCEVEGTIEKFKGHEFISHGGNIVFTHDFSGGLIISEPSDEN
jgi:hypothetical protein